ncbi:MAG: hypothetical protein ACT4PU_05285 [Planctomycetota bacterium]
MTLGALATGLTLVSVNAQNGSNYHVTVNGTEFFSGGLGAGPTQTAQDGIGTFTPGEDMRGSHLVDSGFGPQFEYRNNRFRKIACLQPGVTDLDWPVLFFEMDGLNGNAPAVFTAPVCPGGLVPSFNPYGTGPASSASFVLSQLGSVGTLIGIPTSQLFILPEMGLLGGAGGIVTLVAGANAVVNPPDGSAINCWGVQFQWTPSTVNYFPNIDGVWSWTANSPDGDQYYTFSADELNLWQSNSVGLDGGATALLVFFPTFEANHLWATTEPQTIMALAPSGAENGGPYYTQTENMVGGGFPNFGFDIGAGSRTISFTGQGNQDVANNPALPGIAPTMGIVTFDNGGDGDGCQRLPWFAVDYPQLNNFTFPFAPAVNPDVDPGLVQFFGEIKLPIHATGFMQAATNLAFGIFGHTTAVAASGWPDPEGFAPGAFGVTSIAGGSTALFTTLFPAPPCGFGLAVNITYGTSGLTPSGGITFDPSVADTSYSRECYLFN